MARARSPLVLFGLSTLLGLPLLLSVPRDASALDHFMCYKAKQSSSRICSPGSPANAGGACADDAECGGNAGEKILCVKNKFAGADVFLSDSLESLQFEIRKPVSLCAPANKNFEDPSAPSKPDHLKAYQIKPAKVCSDNQQACAKTTDCNAGAKCAPPKHVKTRILIEDQLGRLVLETKKADRLLVPSSKDHDNPIGPPISPAVDFHKCYAVTAKKKVCEEDPSVKCSTDQDCDDAEVGGACSLGFPKGIFVQVEDQFQDRLYELKKPTRYCPGVSAGFPAGIPNPEGYLTCYQAKPAKGVCGGMAPENAGGACKNEEDCGGTNNVTTECIPQAKHAAVTTLHVNNLLGAELMDTIKEEELCIPQLEQEESCDALAGPPVVDDPTADLNDDGQVSQADIDILLDPAHFGKTKGQVGYIDGLDIAADTTTYPSLDADAPDGKIDQADVDAVRLQCGAVDVATSPTTLSGFVFDGLGNALEAVGISAGQGGAVASTAPTGNYEMNVDPADVGLGEINFFGSTALDPTPGGSGEYPTIPHKPIFLNGGTANIFRAIYLPERDLNGAVLLDDSNSVPGGPPGSRVTTETIVVNNTAIGAALQVPAGCTIVPPPGETAQLSIAAISPGNVPVPPPPGLSSSMFVTYQPGGSQIICTGGTFVATFENVDRLDAGSAPDLYGVESGAFVVVAGCTVLDSDGDSEPNDADDTIVCGPITTPFEFAWYAAIPLGPPCPLTLVAVEVYCNGVLAPPGTNVSIGGGFPACTTNSFSVAGFVDAPAGPSGPNCLSDPFEYTATAWDGSGNIGSATAEATPGGITAIDVEICSDNSGNVGDIVFTHIGPVLFNVDPELYPYLLVETDFAADFPLDPTSTINFQYYFEPIFDEARQGPAPAGGAFGEITVDCSLPMTQSGTTSCNVDDPFGVLPFPGETNASIQWDFAGNKNRFQFFIGIDLDIEVDDVSHYDIFGVPNVVFSYEVFVDRPTESIFDYFPEDGGLDFDVDVGLDLPDPVGDQTN